VKFYLSGTKFGSKSGNLLRRGFLNHYREGPRTGYSQILQGFGQRTTSAGHGSFGNVRLAKATFKRSLPYKHGVVACFRWLGAYYFFEASGFLDPASKSVLHRVSAFVG
jgi:hypothetical protein